MSATPSGILMASNDNRDNQLDTIVNEVVAEAHLSRGLLLPEEIREIYAALHGTGFAG